MDGSVLLVVFRDTIVHEARIGRSDSKSVEGKNIMMGMYARLTGTWGDQEDEPKRFRGY
jgi:hypothetical protein